MRLNWSTLKHKILIFMQNRQGLTSVYAYSDGLNGKPNAWGLLGYCLRKEPQEEFQTTWIISFFLYNCFPLVVDYSASDCDSVAASFATFEYVLCICLDRCLQFLPPWQLQPIIILPILSSDRIFWELWKCAFE